MAYSAASALDNSVLVLNKHYAAIHVISVRRAFGLLYRNLAEVVTCENDKYLSYDFDSWREISAMQLQFEADKHDWVRCVQFQIAVPRIVRLLIYDHLPRQSVKFNRRNIYARDHSRCQYCGKKFTPAELSLDHVLPRTLGGKTTWENIVCACLACNVRKGGRTPEQASMKLISVPIKPKRSPVITLRLTNAKYASWRQFLDAAYWDVELRD